MEEKKKLLIVGGISKNIPNWIKSSFLVEHYEQQTHFKRVIAPKDRPDLVIALKSWISHKQCADARRYALDNNVPFILADGGWSMVVQRAIESGILWFPEVLDKGLHSLKDKDKTECDILIERSWEGAYKREYDKNIFLEKRLNKQNKEIAILSEKIARVNQREDAAQRVLSKIKALSVEQQQKEAQHAEALKKYTTALLQGAEKYSRLQLDKQNIIKKIEEILPLTYGEVKLRLLEILNSNK